MGTPFAFHIFLKNLKYIYSPARPIINLRKFSKENALQIYKLEDEIIIETPEAVVFPSVDKRLFFILRNFH